MENLMLAFRKARKGKSQKPYVKEFEADLENNLLKLKSEMENFTYKPFPMKTFVIRDPKTRMISAPHFRDRMVHHALCNIIEPIFDRSFIHDSYASRKGKGTHAAIRRFDEFKRKVSCNGRSINGAKDDNMIIGYVLKADIKHYFASVDHETMLKIIRKKITDEKAMTLMRIILYSYGHNGKGMPIGSLTSQLFANIYLNELDYFMKHNVKAKFYIRYMDDFVILHKSREILEKTKEQISEYLLALKIELHKEKTKIYPLYCGVNFLGYRIFYHHKLLKKANIRIMIDRIVKLKFRRENNISCEKIAAIIDSCCLCQICGHLHAEKKYCRATQ